MGRLAINSANMRIIKTHMPAANALEKHKDAEQ
jgi:hypothetical protein